MDDDEAAITESAEVRLGGRCLCLFGDSLVGVWNLRCRVWNQSLSSRLALSSFKRMMQMKSSAVATRLAAVELPMRLGQAVLEAQERLSSESLQTAALEREAEEFFNHDWPADAAKMQAAHALKAAATCATLSRPIQAVRALAIYVAKEAQALAESGEWIDSLDLLVEGVQLTHNFITQVNAYQAQILVKRLSELISQTVHTCAAVSSLESVSRVVGLERVFRIARVVWQPSLHTSLDAVARLVLDLPEVIHDFTADDKQGKALTRFAEGLAHTRDSAQEVRKRTRGSARRQSDLTLELLTAWYEMAQQQIMLLAQMNRARPSRLERRELENRVKKQMGLLERELRTLIAHRYAERYGERWIERIQERHEHMYANWMQTLQKDRAAFPLYQEYAPSVLEYAHLGDLITLVAGDWDLFREVFDFGYARRNKAVFQDKMERIIKVRNPLAHHRAIPENELLRTLVLCTDILKAIEFVNS